MAFRDGEITDFYQNSLKQLFYMEVARMSTFLNGYYIEYIIGYTYCTVTSGTIDKFGRFIGKEMVFRSESWEECEEYARTH